MQFSTWTKQESTQAQKENVLDLLRRIVSLDAQTLRKSQAGLAFITTTFNAFMSRTHPLSFKIQVLDLLPFMLTVETSEVH
jgi:hypothetical protein